MPANNKKPLKETDEAQAAFLAYCALDPLSDEGRSLNVLARQLQPRRRRKDGSLPSIKSVRNQLGIWSSAFGWQKRVAEYDRREAERKAKQKARELEKMNENQARQAQALSSLAFKQTVTMLQEDTAAKPDEDGKMPRRNFGAFTLVQLYKEATNAERIARGAATELTKVELTGEDGGPIQTTARLYLPKKDSL